MTETNPAGTVGGIVPAGLEGDEARLAAFARQGRFMFGVEMSVRGEDEREVPWDGASPGRLLVRGPCVVSGYFGADARSEEHTSELQSLMRISYAVFCLKKKNTTHTVRISHTEYTKIRPYK